MKEECKAYTAFTVGLVLQVRTHATGLTDAPVTFQCLMETCLGDLQLSWCIVYLDDITVFDAIPKEHLERLWAVLIKLRGVGLKLRPEKCVLFEREIVYLGHVVSQDGVQTDECKIEVMRRWPVPHTVMEVRSFLGFANYCHQFLKGYALVAQSLHALVSGENVSKKNRQVQWTDLCQEDFDRIKDLSCTAPVLAFTDFKQPFVLHVTPVGLAWVLSFSRPLMERNE